jgi:hypothetical protein
MNTPFNNYVVNKGEFLYDYNNININLIKMQQKKNPLWGKLESLNAGLLRR